LIGSGGGKVFSFIHSKVARRIFFLFVICALLPICVFALVSLKSITSKLEGDSQRHLRQAGINAGMAIHGGLNQLQAELETMPVPGRQGVSRKIVLVGRERRFSKIFVMSGPAGGSTVPDGLRRLSPAARAHLVSGKALISANNGSDAMGPLLMATSANPNLPPHTLLVGEVRLDYLWTLIEDIQAAGVDLCILAPTGKTLYATRPLAPALVSLVISRQKGGSTGQLRWQSKDEDYLVNYWPIFLKPAFLTDSWTVVSLQPRLEVQKPARSFFSTFLLVALLTLCAVVFISSVFIRRNLVPLSTLKEGARRLSGGDFDSRVEISSGDEFEDLAVTFNDMSVQLGKQFSRLSEMGRLVQVILEAHDPDSIVTAVMSRFRSSVPCDWLGVSLVDGGSDHRMMTTYNSGAQSGNVRFESRLSNEEFGLLLETSESLRVHGAAGGFPVLLAPLTAEGAAEFHLLPIAITDRLLGVLILGYRCAPELIREDLLRSRQIADEIAISLDNIRLIDELHWLNRGTIETLANAVDAKSPWTAGHSERVTRLALEIGKEMGLSAADLELLQLGGMFHDMGKIGVPEDILDKPGRLSDEEYALIRKHPEKGAGILEPIRAYHEAIPIVAQHHEQFDGQGYPFGLAGGEIALGARILAVADVFDALYSDRPYRRGWEFDRVVSFLEEKAGSQFDPEVVRAFMKIDHCAYLIACSTTVQPGPEAIGNPASGGEEYRAVRE